MPKMTSGEVEKFIAMKARELSRPTHRPKRRQPKHKGGLVSTRQRIALSQESNPVKAIYEMDRNPTPLGADNGYYTREVGPGNVHNPVWSQSKMGRGESGEAP
jgi:hypothetical protein